MSQDSPPEMNEFLTRQAQDWHGDAKTPPRVTEAVRAAVFGEKKIGWLPHLSRRQVVAAVGVFVIPVSFVATRYVTTRLVPNPTLAAIAKAMSEVRTAQWQNETEVREPETSVAIRTFRQRYLYDLERIAARIEMERGQVHIRNTEGYFSLQGNSTLRLGPPKNAATLKEDLRRGVFNGKEVFKNQAEWQIAEAILNGQRVLYLKRTFPDTPLSKDPIPGGTLWGGGQEIWADPQTFRIVQLRIWFKATDREPPHRVRDVTNTASGYEYDKPIPESAFRVVAPER